jgi:putative ABC transport system permease protein
VRAPGAPPGGAPPDVVIMPGWLPPFAVAFATLIGLLSGLYPAVRATRLDPIVALRQQ